MGEFIRQYWRLVDFNRKFLKSQPRTIVVVFSSKQVLVVEGGGYSGMLKDIPLKRRCASISERGVKGRLVYVSEKLGAARRAEPGRPSSGAVDLPLSTYTFLYPNVEFRNQFSRRQLQASGSFTPLLKFAVKNPTLLIEINYVSPAAIADGVRAAIHESVHIFDQNNLWRHNPTTSDGTESRLYLTELQRNPIFFNQLKSEICLARDAVNVLAEVGQGTGKIERTNSIKILEDEYKRLINRQRMRSTQFGIENVELFWEFAEGVPQFLEQNYFINNGNWQGLTSSYSYYCDSWSTETTIFYPLVLGPVKIRLREAISKLLGESLTPIEFTKYGLRNFEFTYGITSDQYEVDPIIAVSVGVSAYKEGSPAEIAIQAKSSPPPESAVTDFNIACLQVSSSRSRESTKSLGERLTGLGLRPIEVVETSTDNGLVFRLRIGPFGTDEEVIRTRILLSLLSIDYFRVPCY
jgi:hypothetical protein